MVERVQHLNGGVLRWARERGNMSCEYAAGRLSIKDVEKISRWEEGKEGPTYNQLERIADLYGVPVAVFFFPAPPDVEDPKKSLRRLLVGDADAGVLSPGVMNVVHRAQAAQEALREMNDGKNPIESPLHKSFRFSGKAGIARDAAILRGPDFFNISVDAQARWGDFHSALSSWRAEIENRGVFVFQMPFSRRKESSECSGFCLYDEEFPVICLNSKEFKGRQSFTLMHELAHLLRGESALTLLSGGEDQSATARFRNAEVERFCDRFAGELLVPSDDFKARAGGRTVDFNFLREFSRRYWVSESMVSVKCVGMGMISHDERRKLIDERPVSPGRNNAGGGDYYANQIARWGRGFLTNAFARLHQNRVDRFDLCETLRVKLTNLDKLENVFFKTPAGGGQW